MVDQDMNDPADRNECATTGNEVAHDIGHAKSKAVRFGAVTCIVGLIVTLIGARQLAMEGPMPSALPQAIHSLGLVILLVGFSLALLGYRLAWLSAIARSLRASGDRWRRATAGSREEKAWRAKARRRVLIPLCTGYAFGVISLVVIWLSPSWLAGLYIYAMTLFLTSSALVVIASGRRIQRAFAIGAIIPLAISTYHLWIGCIPPGVTSRGMWASYGGQGILSELELYWLLVEAVGRNARLIVSVLWLAALLTGLSAVAVRIVLQRVNEPKKATSEPSS